MKSRMKMDKKMLKILIPIAAVVLVIAVAAIVILPRPNLEMDDMKSPTKMSVLMKYGIPSSGFGSDEWSYDECIKFYGIKLDRCEIDFSSKEITFGILDEWDYDRIVDKIENKADLESQNIIADTYSYNDIEITTFGDDGVFVEFKFH